VCHCILEEDIKKTVEYKTKANSNSKKEGKEQKKKNCTRPAEALSIRRKGVEWLATQRFGTSKQPQSSIFDSNYGVVNMEFCFKLF
jgi:hypothetical protein